MSRMTLLFLFIAFAFSAFGQVSILNNSLKWNVGTHCWDEGAYNPYDRWSTAYQYVKGDTVVNEKHFKKLVSCTDSPCTAENLKAYIREETRRVYLANKFEEVCQFDFNLQKGETMLMQLLRRGDISRTYYVHIDSVKQIVWSDQKERKVQYVKVFDYYNDKLGSASINDVFVEGIGSLNYGLEYPTGLFITGDSWCFPTLLCFYSGNSLIYLNQKINNCYISTGLDQFLDQSNMIRIFSGTSGILQVHAVDDIEGYLHVYDLGGKLILRQKLSRSGIRLCLPSSGVYLYRFESLKHKVQAGKILVN